MEDRPQYGSKERSSSNRLISKQSNNSNNRGPSPVSPSLKVNQCPFVPSLPHAGSHRLAGAQPSLANDLTELRAALQGAGVPIDQQQQQHSSTVSSLQQLRQQVAAPAAAEVRTRTAGVSSTLDYSRIAAELQERTARISSLAGKHDLIDAQRSARPSLTHAALPTGLTSRPGSSLDMAPAEAPAAATAGSGLGRLSSFIAHASFNSRSAGAETLPALQAQLEAFGNSLSKFAAAPNAAGAGAGAVFSSQSSTEQPLTPALSHAPTPQRSGMLAISSSTTSSRIAAEAGLGARLSASSVHQQQLQASQQQDQLSVAQQQELARAGLAQLQEVTHVGQQLRPVVAGLSGAAADAQQKLQALSAFFKQHPQYQDAAALQRLVDESKQLADANKQLKQELFSKSQLLNSALAKVREQNHTPVDKKTAALREEVQMLKGQLHARDAALAASEEDNRRLRDELGLPHRSCDSDLSPCKAEGEVYGSTNSQASESCSPDISRQLWANEGDGGMHSSTCSIASSRSNSCSGRGVGLQGQQQQQQGATAAVKHMAENYQAALAAKEQEVHLLQQQVEELKKAQQEAVPQPQRTVSPLGVQHVARQLSKSRKPRTLEDALLDIKDKTDMIARLQQQMLEQDEQACSRAAEREKAFQRQLQVEKTQLQHERQQGKLLTEQIRQLQEQLAGAQQQQGLLQQQLDHAEQELKEALSASDRSANSSSSGASMQLHQIQQLQRRFQDQKEALITLQEAMQGLHDRVKAAGRLVGPPAVPGQKGALMRQLEASIQQLMADVAGLPEQQKQQVQVQRLQQKLAAAQQQNTQLQEQIAALEVRNEEYETEVHAAQEHLQACEERLLNFQQMANANVQLKQEARELKHSLKEVRAELDKALEGQQATAQHLEQCRQQLAEAAADKALLMDRIREFADRAATGNSSGRASTLGGSLCSSPVPMPFEAQQKLSAACAELNQRVGQLQRQLEDSQAKEERLHLANAQLQERISALQLRPVADEQDLLEQRMQQVQELQQELQQERLGRHDMQAQSVQQELNVTALQQQLLDAHQQLERQQQHSLDLQQQLQQQQSSTLNLQQQLEQTQQEMQRLKAQLSSKEQQLDVQQLQLQQRESEASSQQLAEVQQLQEELEDRTREVLEWQVHADALEQDLADLKERADAADSLQKQLQGVQEALAKSGAEQQALQQELAQCKEHVARLEFDLHDAANDHNALMKRFEGVTAELSRVKDGAADMRLRLEHFTGPAGPNARIRQLEASLQTMQRRYEAADSRATAAAAQAEELATKLSNAEDEILALEGQISILEQELAKYAH